MNTSEDELLSGSNGRLRPRKSQVPSPQGKTKIKPDGKPLLDKPNRTPTSKTSPNKQDDLASKSDFTPSALFLCAYCDRKFASRLSVSKHIRRIHYSTPKQEKHLNCLFCNHTEAVSNLIRHMVDSHPYHYFACLDCYSRFSSTSELAEHKRNVCKKQKNNYRTKPCSKIARGTKKAKKSIKISTKSTFSKHGKEFQEGHGFNGIVISCELKPPQDQDAADIEDNITTNFILPHSKNLSGNVNTLEKNAVIVLDDIQWNKRLPPNFSFHNTDPDQILSRLGVVHRSPRTGESTRKDWFKVLDDTTQKFERCFDTKFYSKVASNVQENLTKFLDGSFNFNPDPDSTIKTRKSKNNVVINTAEGFPTLLATEQYSRSVFDSYLPRAIAPKHKWKWDNLENDRSLMTAAEILKRDSHTNNCIITLVSSLDIWTQLSMRRKFDYKFNVQLVEKKTKKQTTISKELKEILESREIPTSQIVKRCTSKAAPRTGELDFPTSLGLVPAASTYELRPAVLSGEWVRPRCLVCCACGEQTTDSKGLSMHMTTRHPNSNVQCYEIVGEPLLNADILKHLYVPPSQVCYRTRPPRGFRECTKCNKSVTLDDLHQHMLDCAGDSPAIRRRQSRQRPFGVRRRRPRVPDNNIRKKMRKDIRSRQGRQISHGGARPRIRTEVGDAETIRKMLADLPAKRQRVLVNPLNTMQRPRQKLDMQRTKLILKKCSAEEVKSRKQKKRKGTTVLKNATSARDNPKNASGLDDDEDNKPLKPKMKLISTAARRREPVMRQVVISTARRKSVRAGKLKVEIGDKKGLHVSGGIGIQENSLDNTPERLDLKKASYYTREHAANRGASSNHDGQRPGCSGRNGTANNSCAPSQSVPLKHSIARLTANSETHDKSVQFHHSFLVQQECNNTNQHVPSGERTVFENEAVVSKLDKPPLNFCHKSFLEIQSLQKNKPNKPRKGLNDCIAMLKNKLVDPMPFHAAGYVSVQCGSDEPIDDEPRVAIKAVVAIKDITDNVDLHADSLQPQPNITCIPQYSQKITNNNILSQGEDSQIQETQNVVSDQETTKKYTQTQETLQPPDKFDQDTSYNKQLPKKTDISPQNRQEVIQKIKPSLETLYLQEKVDLLPLHIQENLKKVNETHSQVKISLIPQYVEETTHNIKQTSKYSQPQEKTTIMTEPIQDISKNIKHVKELAYPLEVDSTQSFRHEVSVSVKQSSESSLHQYRQDTIPKVTENMQFQNQIEIVRHRHEAAQKLQRYAESLPLPENLSASSQYRQETKQKFKKNLEAICFSENLTMTPKYQTIQNISQSPEALHQEEVTSVPWYKQVNSNLSTVKSAISREIPKTVNKEASPKRLIQNTGAMTPMYLGRDVPRNDRLEGTFWQKSIETFHAKDDILQSPSAYLGTMIRNNSEEALGNDLILSQSIDVFTESRIRDVPANIPPAHASTTIKSIISGPLDLSSTSTNLPLSEIYDNYGTLDLSNKSARRRSTQDIPFEENIVVDLRVKSLHPRSSTDKLDFCVKAFSGDGTVTVSGDNIHSLPTDLSVKRRDSFNKPVELTAVAIQDISKSSSTNLHTTHFITTPRNDNIHQKDSSKVPDKIIKQKVALLIESKDSTVFITKKLSNTSPDDLSCKAYLKKSKTSDKCATNADQTSLNEQQEVSSTLKSKFDSSKTHYLDNLAMQLQKHVFDPTLKIPQYKIRANIPLTGTLSPELNEDPAQAMAVVSQGLAIQNSSSNSSEVFKSTISYLVPTLACAVITKPVPGQSITSCVSSIESTTPVYTANSCIAVAKVKSSNAAVVSPKIPESTKTSSASVLRSTDRAVVSPESTSNVHFDSSSSSSDNSELDASADVLRRLEEDFYDEFVLFLDPEIAKKIALLPKELVKIVGQMPEGHRNQLLEILPQYLSTTAANNSIEANQRFRDSIASIPKRKETFIQKKNQSSVHDRVVLSRYLHQKEVAHTSRQVVGLKKQKRYDILYKPIPAKHEKSRENKYKPVIDSAELAEKSNTMADLKHDETDENASFNDSTNYQDRIIDLTKDDILRPIPKVIDVSSSVTTPLQEFLVSGETGVLSKQKGNSHKTASLRAVRIKAPSLRQREKQSLSLVSDERVLALIEHDAAIQLAEMSVTHSDSKIVIDTKETVIEQQVETLENTIKETGELRADDKNIPATTSDDNKLSSTVTLPNSPLNSDYISNKNQSDAGCKQLCLNAIKVNTNEEYTTTKVCQSGNVTMSPKDNKVAKIQDEEDSEDDIILAAIVKQKQQITILPTKKIMKKKINKKKIKKNLFIECTFNTGDNTVTLSSNVDTFKLNKIEDLPKNKIEQNKKKSTSVIFDQGIVRQEQHCLRSGNEAKNKQLPDLDACSESHNSGTEEHGKENNDNFTNVNRTNQTESISQDILLPKAAFNLKQSENVVLKDKPKNKKNFADLNSYNLTEQDNPIDTSVFTTAVLKSVAFEPTPTENNTPKSSKLLTKRNESLVIQEGLNEDFFESKCEVKKSVKLDRFKKYSSGFSKENSTTECQDDEDNSDMPLRRSRRGKYVFSEGSLTAPEYVNIDFTADQKAPLTKKQLIFSKLLLDEENQTRSLISTAVKQITNDVDKFERLTTGSEIYARPLKADVSEDAIQKCKSVKRKKSLQFGKRGKKKKSLGGNVSEDSLLTEGSDINVKGNQEMFRKKDTMLSTYTINCAEPNDQIPEVKEAADCKITNTDIENSYSIISTAADKEGEQPYSSLPSANTNIVSNSLFLEKRKISERNNESDQNLKSKKTKFCNVKLDDFYEIPENKMHVLDREIADELNTKPEKFVSTCYDVPVAGRRTRSKSVVIKSSQADSYDPYDIDLDDMIQKLEPLRKPKVKAKEIKSKRKSSSNLTEEHISDERDLPVDQKHHVIKSAMSNKIKYDLLVPIPNINKAVCDQEVKRNISAMFGGEKIANNTNLNKPTTKASDLTLKDVISDSDESSKSDVPLKKYVEGRVKKLAATGNAPTSDTINTLEHHYETEAETKKYNTNRSKKNVRTLALNKDSYGPDLSNEIEQQMRSEQFMESFGFFSERKPRKSNLLATKKISETFHVIANEGEDLYYSSKERPCRKSVQTVTKKTTEESYNLQSSVNKNVKRGRKKKIIETLIRYCNVCKKEFRRPDNYSRHLMTLLHVSKLLEVELKIKTIVIPEEPNYLIAYKQQMDRLKILTDKAAKQKKNSKTKIVLPSLVEILAEVRKTVREQQLSRRGLSRDEALFLDCCELLNKPSRPDLPAVTTLGPNAIQASASSVADLGYANGSFDRSNIRNDDDVDSVTARNIMESEEVRNLENDLISGLHQMANVKNVHKKDEYHATPCTMTIHPHEISPDIFSRPDCDVHCQQMKGVTKDLSATVQSELNKTKKPPEYKEKMYPDVIEDIDMYEDKFDKIKRKCRSQAAAAKQVQSVTEPSSGNKERKTTEKKKEKKGSKKNHHNTVMTKGALKGFDGIKVSIPTSDINMSAIGVVLPDSSQKKKRKAGSKKKRDKECETSSRFDSDHHLKSTSYSQKKVDVYEFMDNEDAELFEFRPSTLIERFKSISKETPSTSKRNAPINDPDNSSESADDFVYMSDDYVCSDDETENSSLSCELGNVKNDAKKSTPLKRKDVVEKNAVMGKIFKQNAVRPEKTIIKSKEAVKLKTNLDQLFDSLLEEEPNKALLKELNLPKLEEVDSKKHQKSSSKSELSSLDEIEAKPRELIMCPEALDTTKSSVCSNSLAIEHDISINKYDLPKRYKYGPLTSKQDIDIYAPSSAGTYIATTDNDETLSKKRDSSPSKRHDITAKSRQSLVRENILVEPAFVESFNMSHESGQNEVFDEDTGVARHRARRKCTVGKQNILAETWSSESEPDGLLPRPASADSIVAGAGKKKKGRKRDGQQAFGRRGKVTFNKKHYIESRVTSNKWNTTAGASATSHNIAGSKRSDIEKSAAASDRETCPPPAPLGPACASASAAEASTSKVRPRPAAYYWTSEGDDEQEHQQQHGWIVGNSHKRLVTMLAHAKGRKRNNYDKRHLVE